ncbi:MAG TPA: TorF family putative porin [Allosphingosinicella sp.]|nr:TorF family putative porin [Allosphingosinicella sp.]
MRKTLITGLSALAFSTFLSTPAMAAEIGSGFSVNGGATLVSDYRFRGISQTDRDFALQGTISVSHASGFYGTIWGSSIDDYVAGGSDQELDFILGYKKTFGGTTLDVGVLYYYYPGAEKVFAGLDTDFFEPYVAVSHTFGPVTGKVTAAYAPKQNALSIGAGKEDGLYLAGDLTAAIPNTPISLSGHIGHSFQENYITFADEYTDWSIGASYTTGPLTIGVQYVDTDATFFGSTKNVSKAGVVGSIGVAF